MAVQNLQKYFPAHLLPQIQAQDGLMGNSLAQKQPENLEHNPDRGIFILQAEGENLEISSAQFNPKHRYLAAGGNFYMATMWDLRREPNSKFGEEHEKMPHIKR